MNPTIPSVTDPKQDAVNAVKKSLSIFSTDVEKRNSYIDKRRRYIYDEGLFEDLDFSRGRDKTMYNFCARAIDIHTSQFMGRGFRVYSTYNKADLSIFPEDSPELKQAELDNKQKKAYAEARKKAIDAIIRDNGGMEIFKRGAKLGSEGGNTVFKAWWDEKSKSYKIQVIENVNNYWAGWTATDFRDRDFDAYVYQISESSANRNYGSYLQPGESFETSVAGQPLVENVQETINGAVVSNTNPFSGDTRSMITVTEYTGYLTGFAGENGNLKAVAKGKETPVNLHIVGNKLCSVITDESKLPHYYVIANKERTNWPWGLSDLSEGALDINKTYIDVMATGLTLYHKEVAPTYLAKGFGTQNLPKRQKQGTTMIPMELSQDISLLDAPQAYVSSTRQFLDELKENFVREVGIGRVMFDDPSINPTSNQALMTTLKPIVDIAEAKQARWEPELLQMFKDALEISAKHVKELKDAVADPGWELYIEWPSVLRKEDATWQQTWLNLFNAGVISIDTYLEKIGVDDTSEEVDRTRDDMKDPVKAAMRGRMLGEMAQQLISPAPTGPTPPQVKYNVNVKSDATLDPSTNIGVIDEVMGGDPEAFPAPQPGQATPDQANPTLTPDQNTGQTASQPGSGTTAVSAEGANAMVAQQNGA